MKSRSRSKKKNSANQVKEKKELGIVRFFKWLASDIKEIGTTFTEGDILTKLSFFFMGVGSLCRGVVLRGLAFLAIEVGYIYYMITTGWKYMVDLATLGTVETTTINFVRVYGDNSFLILLYGVLALLITLLFIFIWRLNVKENYEEELAKKRGRKLPTLATDIRILLDKNFDKTLLALPVTGVMVFTVVPIIFMICVAFTNYDKNHQPPQNLFDWVGFENFKLLFSSQTQGGFGGTFAKVLGWTLIWAFFATFLTYFGGMAVAILINKKGVKFKKLWRTILVMTIAIPQFVSLLYVSKMFANDGLINSFLMSKEIIEKPIKFWANKNYARVTIILINCWIGIPYTMLISTGLLMNIPADLYESARIDGANAWQMFIKITLPYMLFVTGPYLLTSFTGNLNNFNVIYLLTGGGPTSMSLTGNAGSTDLLVTWLYKMTVNNTDYKMTAVIGIMVFIVTAVFSLGVYNLLPSVRDEEGFQ